MSPQDPTGTDSTDMSLDRLAATADPTAAQSVLRQVIALAEQAPRLTNEQLRGPTGCAGRVGPVTVTAQRMRQVPRTPTGPVVHVVAAGADVAGHGLLSRFHAGCRCGWCCSRAREGRCGCGPCVACRVHTYFVLPRG